MGCRPRKQTVRPCSRSPAPSRVGIGVWKRTSNIWRPAVIFWLCSRDVSQTSSSRIFLRELENYTDCPELVGRCFLERVRASQMRPSAGLTP